MRRVHSFAVALFIGCATIAVSCGSSGPENALPPGWITFENESISLALPESFGGGNLTDAEVAAKFDRAAAVDPNLDLWSTATRVTDVQLLMFGSPDANGFAPMVLAVSSTLREVSLEQYIEFNKPDQGPGTKVETESLTDDEARVVVTLPSEAGGDTSGTTYWAIRREGSSVFSVFYYANSEAFADMDSIFRNSADTIVLKKSPSSG
jgi:hypothetical protein